MRASTTLKLTVPVMLLAGAACGNNSASSDTVALKPKIVISSTTAPTSKMLAEIYGQALEKSEFRVARKKAYESTDALIAAMTAGDVQLSAVTSQTLFKWVQAQTGSTDPMPNTTTKQAEVIVKGLPQTLKIGVASTAEDKDVIFCAKTFTDTNAIATLTDLGAKPGIATIAAPDGFDTATPLGAAALKDLYKVEFKSVVATPADKVLAAVNAGTADCGTGRAADPALAVATLTVLADDKALVPNDVVLPLLYSGSASDDVLASVDATSGRLTTEQLRTLMQRLKVDGAPPEVVANEFTGSGGQ